MPGPGWTECPVADECHDRSARYFREPGSSLPAPTFESDLGAELVRIDASGDVAGERLRHCDAASLSEWCMGERFSESLRSKETDNVSCCAPSQVECALARQVAGKKPIGFIPEDRTTEGLIPDLSLTENVMLGLGSRMPHGSEAGGSSMASRRGVEHPSWCDSTESLHSGPLPARQALSGGNQQKLIVARELSRNPAVHGSGKSDPRSGHRCRGRYPLPNPR